jgi:hypothetical protein
MQTIVEQIKEVLMLHKSAVIDGRYKCAECGEDFGKDFSYVWKIQETHQAEEIADLARSVSKVKIEAYNELIDIFDKWFHGGHFTKWMGSDDRANYDDVISIIAFLRMQAQYFEKNGDFRSPEDWLDHS